VKRASSISGKSAKTQQREAGVAAVELAIILPLFGILLLGVIEVGGLARDHQVLQNAAREGARFSSLPSNRMNGVTNPTAVETTIKDRIIAYLANERITVTSGNITVNQGYTMPLGTVNVPASEITIVYNRPILFPGISNWFSLATTVQGRAVFRNFY
jgi:Flp pilus assembly protein TadG